MGTGLIRGLGRIGLKLNAAQALTQWHATDGATLLRLHSPHVQTAWMMAPLLTLYRRRQPHIRQEKAVDTMREPPIEDGDTPLLHGAALDSHRIRSRAVTQTHPLRRVGWCGSCWVP